MHACRCARKKPNVNTKKKKIHVVIIKAAFAASQYTHIIIEKKAPQREESTESEIERAKLPLLHHKESSSPAT